MIEDPLEVAIKFHGMQIATFPIIYKEKRPAIKSWKIYQTNLPYENQLQRWFSTGEPINIAVVMGWRGLFVIDFDDIKEYRKWDDWIQRGGKVTLSDTLTVRTSRGIHVYILNNQTAPHNKKLQGIDIKGQGGYVLGPGSTHPDGSVYRRMTGYALAVVGSLSEALPLSMLQHIEQPPNVRIPRTKPALVREDNPWKAAFNPPKHIEGGLIEDIKSKVRIEDYFPGAERSSQGYLMTNCPFHEDKTPSFWIDVKRQICSCFACRMPAMDVINLYAALHGMTNSEAIYFMRQTI